jgi:hypothetical protein
MGILDSLKKLFGGGEEAPAPQEEAPTEAPVAEEAAPAEGEGEENMQ